MIILDTNVLSEVMRASPDPAVVTWLDRQPALSVWITAISAFETRFGLATLPNGRRRKALEAGYDRLLNEVLDRRVLPVDKSAADAAAILAGERRTHGIQVDFRDTLIAGIAISQHATLATRNVKDFQDASRLIKIVNPWSE